MGRWSRADGEQVVDGVRRVTLGWSPLLERWTVTPSGGEKRLTTEVWLSRSGAGGCPERAAGADVPCAMHRWGAVREGRTP
jgi:hypothetical protein